MLSLWWEAACFCLSKNVLISSLFFKGNMSEHKIHKTIISFKTFFFKISFALCVCVPACMHMRVCSHRARMEVRAQLAGVTSLLPLWCGGD